MFNRLVGGAVFAQTNRVVREHMDHALLHQRSHADRVARVVAEGEEGAAIRNEATVQCHAIHDGSHAKFAHAVVDVPPRGVIWCLMSCGAGVGDHVTC